MPELDVKFDLPKIVGTVLCVIRFFSIACFLYCAVGLYQSLSKSIPIWRAPRYAEGKIIENQERAWQQYQHEQYIGVTAQMPVVEFRDEANTPIRFIHNIGPQNVQVGPVPVIYASGDPQNARINKGWMNWLGDYIWLFGMIGSLLGVIRLTSANIKTIIGNYSKILEKNNSHPA